MNGEYSHDLTNSAQAYLRGLLNYSSSAPGTPGAGLAIPASTTVNAFLGVRGSQGENHGWDGFVYVRNLFDSRYFRTSSNEQVVFGVPTGYHDVFSLPQRQYGVTVSYHY
jgi:outer membrane receptor protein involved in Fe transport